MLTWCSAVALCYASLCAAIAAFEYGRIRKGGVDPVTLFMVVFLLQCGLPGVVIFALLPAAGLDEPTGNWFFDHVFRATDATIALMVFSLTLLFVLFFYVGCAIGRAGLQGFLPRQGRVPEYVLRLSQWRVQCVLIGGLLLCLLAFYLLGDSFIDRYTNLILLRSNAEAVERTFLNADALSLTQAWAWLAILGLLATYDFERRRGIWALCAAYTVVFAFLGVSRRAFFLPFVLAYLTQLLRLGRWRFRWIVASAIPIGLIVVFGAEALSVLAFGGEYSVVTSQYRTAWSGLLRAFSEVGISNVESLGTVALVDLKLRFGVDHLLSVARRVPEGMFGLDFDFPERVVRYTTAVFAGPEEADIPPGFFGQMWLDFGVFGPPVWGVLFGLQMSIVQVFYRLLRASWQSSAVITLIVFVVALPLNTGSFDFTFSVDIIALAAALWWCTELRRTDIGPSLPQSSE